MIDERLGQTCAACGKPMTIEFAPFNIGFIPRTVGLKGKDVKVTSAGELVNECRKRGLVHRGYMYHDKEKP